MPDTPLLIKSVNELRVKVEALTDALEGDYLKRHEIEKKYISKESSRRRVISIFFFTLLALFISYFVTVSTVSTCFLRGEHPSACYAIPGYSRAEQDNRDILEEFHRLQDESGQNKARIDKLERQQR